MKHILFFLNIVAILIILIYGFYVIQNLSELKINIVVENQESSQTPESELFPRFQLFQGNYTTEFVGDNDVEIKKETGVFLLDSETGEVKIFTYIGGKDKIFMQWHDIE